MTGSMIVNNLAGLMMLTSLFVISVKSYRLSGGFYACQSLVLVSISPLSRACSPQSNC